MVVMGCASGRLVTLVRGHHTIVGPGGKATWREPLARKRRRFLLLVLVVLMKESRTIDMLKAKSSTWLNRGIEEVPPRRRLADAGLACRRRVWVRL